jgi:RHS repeat-associated protein
MKTHSHALGWSVILPGTLLLLFPQFAAAKYIGADPTRRDCGCACSCVNPQLQERSNTSTTISRTEGNLMEHFPVSVLTGGAGANISLTAVYNSYNADGSRSQVDTVMGYGWTHSYNIFLFNQLGAMFRYDGDGRVTRYALGPGNTFVGQTGAYETLVKNPDGTFTLTQKDDTTYNFASVPGTPFLVAGPVYMLTSIVDRNGNRTTFTYTAGVLTNITNSYGRSLTLSYNAQNHLASVSDPAGRVTQFQYDSTGRKLTTITDPNGKTIQYSYNVLYQLTSKTDKAGRTFSYSYVNAEPAAVKDGLGNTPAILSNPNNWATNSTTLAMFQMRVYLPSTATNTDGRGNPWQYQYDTNGHVTQTTSPAPDNAVTKYTYDSATLEVASITDALGRVTQYQFNSQGDLTQRTDALGHATMYTYDPTFNMVTSMTDPLGRTTTYTVDPANGNRVKETDPLGNFNQWSYDSHGNIIQSTDKNGNTTTYQYDAFGCLIQQTEAFGTPDQSTTQYTCDAVGNRASMTDGLGRVTQYLYDGMNRLIQETDAVGTPQQRTIQTFYDGEGNRTQAIDGRTISTVYQYDLRQRLVTETDASGTPQQRSITTTYDANDNRVTVTDSLGRITTFQYDSRNRVIQEIDATGTSVQATTQTSYDIVSNVTTRTDANGHTASYTYDSLNRRSTVTDALGEKTLYFYDAGTFSGPVTLGGVTVNCIQCGATPGSSLATKEVDPDGVTSLHAGTTFFYYDELDRVVIADRKTGCIAGPAGSGCPGTINTATDAVTLNTYDPVGNRLTYTEPDANTTHYQYDHKNRLTQTTNAAGDVSTTAYDAVNNVTCVTAPDLNVTCNSYDALNRVVSVTDSIGLVSTASYDADDNRLTSGDGNGHVTSYAYDALNRQTTATDPLGKVTTLGYDSVGNVLSVIDRDGNKTAYAYDALNRRSTMTDALGNVTQWQYDSVGNLTKLIDANLHPTQYSYDFVNRPQQQTYADGTSRSYTYDPAGNLIKRQDATPGQSVVYSYNDLYCLAGRLYAPSGADDLFGYDLSCRLLTNQRTNGSFTWPESFTYDGANRITQSTQNLQTITYSYDIPGKKRTLTYPSGRVITEHTDFRARMDHIDDAGSPPSIAQYSYDLADNMLARNYRNGTTSSYTYNANNWTTSITHQNPGTFAGFNYAYDSEGNKQYEQKVHDPTHSECYGYDNTYRVTSYGAGTLGSTCPVVPPPTPPTQTSYSLDPVGNWNTKTTNGVTQTRSHNSVNEITLINATTLTYDNDGDLTNDGTYQYQYDEEHRLTNVTRTADSALVGRYQYDALGRRVQKIANPAGTPATTQYFYDDTRVVEEQSDGATQATYVYGNYVDEILTMNRGGQTYYYYQNALWSAEAITNSAGSPVERYDYCGGNTLQCGDPYGAVSVTDGAFNPISQNAWGTPHSGIGNPYLFTGRQLDEETGLHYYRARYYDAGKGRFLQRDPLDATEDGNFYEYVRGNPLNYVDPNGTAEKELPKQVQADIPDDLTVTLGKSSENIDFTGSGKDTIKVTFSGQIGGFAGLSGKASSVKKVNGKQDQTNTGGYYLRYDDSLKIEMKANGNNWDVTVSGSQDRIAFCYFRKSKAECTRTPATSALLEGNIIELIKFTTDNKVGDFNPDLEVKTIALIAAPKNNNYLLGAYNPSTTNLESYVTLKVTGIDEELKKLKLKTLADLCKDNKSIAVPLASGTIVSKKK